MALIRVGFFSKTLGMCTSCDVILPQQPACCCAARPFPTVYLLHSFSKNHTSWQRLTSIERYACRYGVAVVMPDAQLSSYADMIHGRKWFTFIADELPGIMRGFFPLSDKREETFICGASMGGYGALRIALNRPETFGAAGSLSAGCFCYRGYVQREFTRGVTLEWLTFGDDGLDAEDADIAAKAKALAASGENAPRVFITCGTEDPILLDNCREARDFFSAFEGNPFDFTYTEHPGGHDWDFWDAHICDFFEYAGLRGNHRLL